MRVVLLGERAVEGVVKEARACARLERWLAREPRRP